MKLFGWGANNYGQLGTGYICEQCVHPTPVIDGELLHDNIKYVTGGGSHTLILDNAGRIYGCGSNSSYQLGSSDSCNLPELKRIDCLDKYRISEITCGWDSSFAVTRDDHALVWGSNVYGQLGLSKNKIKKIHEPCYLPFSGVTQISSGLRHTAVLMNNGKVLVSGQGRKGQLGLLEDKQPLTQTDVFQEVPYLEDVKMIACGQHHTLALTKNGNLFAWGDNKHGQLGCDPNFNTNVYTPSLIESVKFSCRISSVLAGWTHSVLLTDDGLTISFGRNCYGQRGLPQGSSGTWNPSFVPLNDAVKQVVVGSEHNITLTENGEVWSWGWNEHGNCGLGNDDNVFTPRRVELPSKSVLIGTGFAHSFALTE